MLKSILLPIVTGYVPNMIRHGATAAGTYLVTAGLADASTSQSVTGALIVLGTFGWSIIEKKGLLKALIG